MIFNIYIKYHIMYMIFNNIFNSELYKVMCYVDIL